MVDVVNAHPITEIIEKDKAEHMKMLEEEYFSALYTSILKEKT